MIPTAMTQYTHRSLPPPTAGALRYPFACCALMGSSAPPSASTL